MMANAGVRAAPVPQMLLNFFARYPPNVYSAKFTGASYPSFSTTQPQSSELQAASSLINSQSTIPLSLNSSSAGPDQPSIETTVSAPPSKPSLDRPNPFLPWKNPETGRWRGATVSLRRQADLVKLAKKHGVESLLPPGRKSTVFKETRILEKGLRVKGTGEGQKVKGHKWERTMNTTLEKRRKAMEEMPELIRTWKQVSKLPLKILSVLGRHTDEVNNSEVMEEDGRSIPDKTNNTHSAHRKLRVRYLLWFYDRLGLWCRRIS